VKKILPAIESTASSRRQNKPIENGLGLLLLLLLDRIVVVVMACFPTVEIIAPFLDFLEAGLFNIIITAVPWS
jgi:hypothetical protein